MGFFKQLFNFYINSSIHVALSVYALSRMTLLNYGLPYDEPVLYFNFYATITGYNFVKYFGIAKFYHKSLTQWLRLIQLFSLLCFLLMFYYVVQLTQETLYYISVFATLTFLYAIPFLPQQTFLDKHKNLRSIKGLKIYLIALIWTGVTVLLPLINNKVLFNVDVLISFVQRFLFVFALMLPFEIRDLKRDDLKLSTIPQVLGIYKTKIIGGFVLLTICILQFFKNTNSPAFSLILVLIMLLTFLLILISKKEQRLYFSSFFVEGIPIIWCLIVCYLSY